MMEICSLGNHCDNNNDNILFDNNAEIEITIYYILENQIINGLETTIKTTLYERFKKKK